MPLPFKSFEAMTPEDYANIGLKVGLEVHQQLLTRRKLFCRCPAGRYSDTYDAEILRHMRPTLSELGEYDGTALMEKKTRKNIFYRIHRETVCTYEMDDTPPFFMDEDALEIGLEIALLLRLNLVSELHVSRKQYLDGSIPTGFQRTTILGVDGWIPHRDRRIGIIQLGLEEDACREVSDVGHDRVFLTDRLGMPLIEVVTYPDLRTPQEAAEVGQLIRRLCRSTGKTRTGYGAARQDVNVSVAGGTRCEIKGTPQIWRNPRLIYNEARRQCSLLHIRGLLRERGVTPETFQSHAQDVSRIVSQTTYEPIRAALAEGQVVCCVVLRGFAGLLNEETQEHTTFAKEFSDRVRVIACLTKLPNLIHSDLASECLSGREWKQLRRRMRADAGDALLLVWGNEQDARCAGSEIALRGREAAAGVPSDTRQALKDGTNGFERVLPGAERMYPDTDLPPRAVEQELLERIRARLPEYVWDREARYRELRLPEDVIEPLAGSPRVPLFERLVRELEIEPVFAAVVLIQRLRGLRRAGLSTDQLTDEEVYEVFKVHAEGRLSRQGVLEVLAYLADQEPAAPGGPPRVARVFEELRLEPVPDAALTRAIDAKLAELDPARFPAPAIMCRYLLGRVMEDFVGRVEGRHVARLVHARLGLPLETRTPLKAHI
jgi:glutamyl-tRNA(Gln) amidotransferase subunit E